MKISNTTFLRIAAIILVAAGAYGIYSWQMKTEKVKVITPDVSSPWYYFAIPLFLLIVFGLVILAKHLFQSPGRKLLLIFALFCGVAYFGVRTFDSLPKINRSSYHSETLNPYTPSSSGRTVATEPPQSYPSSSPAPVQQAQPAASQPSVAVSPPPRERSYEECWQIARQAYNSDSVAVPPECQQAWENYKQRQNEIAQAQQQRERDEREQRQQAERERREQEARDQQIAEQKRRDQEEQDRKAEQLRIERLREQERRLKELGEGIRRIIKHN